MKKLIVIFITCSVALGAFAQASTEGKEFWVATTFAITPPGNTHNPATPYIAVSAKTKGTVITLTNPAYPNWSVSYTTQKNNEWHEFVTGNVDNQFMQTKISPSGYLYPETPTLLQYVADVVSYADVTTNCGIKVTATRDVSVYSVLRTSYAMDATNILPTKTLLSEYYMQDYWPEINGADGTPIVSMAAILATENNTMIDITPTTPTYNNAHPANQTFQITLNQGQVYYLMGQDGQQLAGTSINARDNKKIAVFLGEACTRVPSGVSARDCLYEQAMPVDYWGTEFVVTRSFNKDANIIGITAMEDNTEIRMGALTANIDKGETYFIEIQQNDPAVNKASKLLHPLPANQIFNLDALYIETSCPCAVYSYDTGNDYKGKNSTMPGDGDPSSVWIAPLQQSIKHITFGTCHTDKTQKHHLDVVCPTASTGTTILSSNKRQNIPLTFNPVPGNANYSYASMLLVNDNEIQGENVFTLSNTDAGFVAHVYGHGEDESYAYSVGSSAVKRGIQIGDYTLEDGMSGSNTYCVNSAITFNAQVGTDIIDRAYWDMGDGVSYSDVSQISFDYSYDTPGWYDVIARVSAHKVCPDTVYPEENVHVRIHVVRPDTFITKKFICQGDTLKYGGKTYTEATTDTVSIDCDSIVIFQLEVGQKSSYAFSTIERDSFVFAGSTYYKSGTYTATLTNASGCDSVVTAYAKVLTCLDIQVGTPDSVICADEAEFRIPYIHTKGDIGAAFLLNRGLRIPIVPSQLDNAFVIPLTGFTADHYTKAAVLVVDTLCGDTLRFPVSFDVLYPSSVFNQKWDNTLVLYNKDYNGGYDFKVYQWYKNGQPIPGATEAFYVEDPLDKDAYYQVLLTRFDSLTNDKIELMTCPYYPHVSHAASAAETDKLLENGRLYILKDGIKYSVLGVAVKKEKEN